MAVRAIRFQSGGMVPGQGPGDKVPAFLESGEYVINKRATEQFKPLLDAINTRKFGAPGTLFSGSPSSRESSPGTVTSSGGLVAGETKQTNVYVTVKGGNSIEETVMRIKRLFDTWVVEAVEAAIERGDFRPQYALSRG